MAAFTFDASAVEGRDNSYELLPAGWYTAQVIDSEVLALKTGNGRAIKLTFEVLADGYRGRRVWTRLNVQHTNPTTEGIAQQHLKELCDSIGLARMTDTVDLHNKPLQIRIKIRKDESGQYGDSNEIGAYRSAGGLAAPAVPRAAGAPVAPPANTGSAPTPPWAKKTAA